MLSYIEKLRQKPEKERRKFVLIFSSVLMLVIVTIWIFTLISTFSKIGKEHSTLPKTESVIGKELKDIISEFKVMVKDTFGESSTTKEITPVVPIETESDANPFVETVEIP